MFGVVFVFFVALMVVVPIFTIVVAGLIPEFSGEEFLALIFGLFFSAFYVPLSAYELMTGQFWGHWFHGEVEMLLLFVSLGVVVITAALLAKLIYLDPIGRLFGRVD